MQTPPYTRIALLFLAAATLLATAGPAAAQISNAQVGQFGTQVRLGDADYVPLTKKDGANVVVYEMDFGIPGDVRDNCLILASDARNTATTTPAFKDIRLTPCHGHPAGTLVADADVVEKQATYSRRTTTAAPAAGSFQYADVNGNGKYDKGDSVYLTTATAAPLIASNSVGVWTLRITPAGTFPAGTFVFAGDQDFVGFGSSTKTQAFSLAEREDKGWYLIPSAVPTCGTLDSTIAANWATAPSANLKICDESSAPVYKNGLIPANAIRIAITGTNTMQPGVTSVGVVMGSVGDVSAGKDFSLLATISNGGATSGNGLIVTRVNGAILDARLSPVLSPGETTQMLVTVTAPAYGGSYLIKVNDASLVIHAQGATSAPSLGTADLASLQAKVADLESRLAAIEAAAHSPAATTAKPAATLLAMTSPSPVAPMLLLALGLVAVVLRRRT